jgi:hypothetical protein
VLFNSYPFVFGFLPMVLAGFAMLARWRARRAGLTFLMLASLAFYAWWNWRFLPLILFSIIFNFWLGTHLQQRRTRREASVRSGRAHGDALLGLTLADTGVVHIEEPGPGVPGRLEVARGGEVELRHDVHEVDGQVPVDGADGEAGPDPRGPQVRGEAELPSARRGVRGCGSGRLRDENGGGRRRALIGPTRGITSRVRVVQAERPVVHPSDVGLGRPRDEPGK